MSESAFIPRAMLFDSRGRPTPKRATVAAFLLGDPDLTITQVAEAAGVSRQYVYQVKEALRSNPTAEYDE